MTYAPDTRVDVHHDGAWRPATIVALTDAQRARLHRCWPLGDWSRAVGVLLDGTRNARHDLVIGDPDNSGQLRPHLRAVR